MRIRRLALLAASAVWLSACGCATTKPATPPPPEPPAPSLRYSTGRAVQDFALPAATVRDAVLEVFDELNFTVTRRSQDGPVSQVEGRTPDHRGITVTLRPQKPVTHTSCRIGWFGDEPMSRAVMRRVAVRLGVLPPEEIPDHLPSKPGSNPYFSRDAIPDSEMMRDMIEAPYRSRPDL